MGLFERKRRLLAAEDHADTLSSRFGKWYKAQEMHLANYLNQKTKTYGFRQWLIMLTGFCLIVGSYLGYLLLGIFK